MTANSLGLRGAEVQWYDNVEVYKTDVLKEVAIMRGFLSFVVLSALLFTGLFASHTNAEPMPNIDGSVEQQIRIKAEQGDAEAQNNLGVMYANGKGVVAR